MEVAVESRATLGEGPRWDAERARLLWVDIECPALHRFDPGSGENRTLELDERISLATPVEGGGLLLALAARLALLDEEDGSLRTLAEMPHGPEHRLNDGACDPHGRLWVGSMALDERPGGGALYRYTRPGGLEQVLRDVTLSNGIGWSPDGTLMYYVDSPAQRVDVFDYDAGRGEPSGRRPWAGVDEDAGIPDGLAVDEEGAVWVALYGGGAVRRYDAGGRLDRVLEVPAANVTACCFGGPDGRSLFVTTARQGLGEEELTVQPLAGSVFVAEVDVAGLPVTPLAG